MDEKIQSFIREFKGISQKGWIKSTSKSTGSIGITFEKELGNNENNSALPDYHGIEIKCSSNNSIYPITLFSMTFDGPTINEMWRIVNKYGYPDKNFPKRNILYSSLSCKSKYLVNNQYYFQLEVNKTEEKLFLLVYDKDNNLIEKRSFIRFRKMREHLETKLSKLAYVKGMNKYENGTFYFKYYKLLLFQLKSFDTFLALLENNIISVHMIYRINKSSSHYGKPSSKNVVFSINKSNISKLFEKIIEVDYSKNEK